ncbi:MAG: TRAP transporter large permease subunit [Synergistetes bacterium]|nr:TRAP transporter large permease subunit [Synergistota bacterium]MCX8127698.1 TRAP transporter large permease subunit [Synergistota bacterium]MDW8191387.1 TRAP transporter large permease subunit [Synergistota bacterium]
MILTPETITVLMFLGVFLAVISGFPFALGIGTVGFALGALVFGLPSTIELYYSRIFAQITNYTLLAIPLFVFMGNMLERSGITESLFETLYILLGRLRGGLAVATVLMGTILAACVGVIAASVTALALLALGPMVKRGYDKALASGTVCAAGTLGILIPPSIMLVVYGPAAGISVGKLFFGAFFPGFLLSFLYCLYILIYCLINKDAGPAVPLEEIIGIPLSRKLKMLLVSLVPPVILILAVLGSIFFGIAAPTEAAAVGSFAAIILAIAYRRFSWGILKSVAIDTFRLSGMVFLILAMASAFVGVFLKAGCGDVVGNLILKSPGGKWGVFIVIMAILFFLGMFIDWLGIVLLLVPIVTPIAAKLGFDPIWFAMMVCVNLQMSFLTPPFAYAIFFLKGTAPPELGIETNHIIRGVIPFIVLIMIGLALCVAFPQIILWLPSKMFTR